jgi:hypothetical protein
LRDIHVKLRRFHAGMIDQQGLHPRLRHNFLVAGPADSQTSQRCNGHERAVGKHHAHRSPRRNLRVDTRGKVHAHAHQLTIGEAPDTVIHGDLIPVARDDIFESLKDRTLDPATRETLEPNIG